MRSAVNISHVTDASREDDLVPGTKSSSSNVMTGGGMIGRWAELAACGSRTGSFIC